MSKLSKEFRKRLKSKNIAHTQEVKMIPGRSFRTDYLITYYGIRICCEVDSQYHDLPSQKKSDKEKDGLHKMYGDKVIRFRSLEEGQRKIKQTIYLSYLEILLKRSILIYICFDVYFIHSPTLSLCIILFLRWKAV